MKVSSALKTLFNASGKPVVIAPVIFILITACSTLKAPEQIQEPNKYNADTLAKEWRAQVRQNPHNPYEGLSFPTDNDSEYYSPKKRTQKNSSKAYGKTQPSQNNLPAFEDNDDSSYGRFPRYNPDDDNEYPTESKDYPLYLD